MPKHLILLVLYVKINIPIVKFVIQVHVVTVRILIFSSQILHVIFLATQVTILKLARGFVTCVTQSHQTVLLVIHQNVFLVWKTIFYPQHIPVAIHVLIILTIR
jgi:hypothetical protein